MKEDIQSIYMDNAATSFPKPPTVVEAMVHFMENVGANPGRSRHEQSMEASHIVDQVRESLASLFHAPDPNRIIFTLNATEALNAVIYGFLNPGDHVIITQMEHNSVIRPVRHLEQTEVVTVSVVPCNRMGFCDPGVLKDLIQHNTALICLNHASNVCGTIQDVAGFREMAGDIPILLDVAQTAGALPIDVQALGIDFLAFAGHKALYGPQGTGGLYIREGLTIQPLKRGGTGTRSEDPDQPHSYPDWLESGTRNTVGIAGLGAGVRFILEKGIENIRRHEMELLKAFVDGIKHIAGLTLYGPLKPEQQMAIVSMTFDKALPDGLRPSIGGCGGRSIPATFDDLHPQEAGTLLKDKHHISVRVGLHCAPLAHQALGTLPDGTVRFSLGYFNTLEEVEIAIEAVKNISDKLEYFDED